MYNYRVYNNLFGIFLIQMKYRLKSMYTHLFLMQLQAVYRKFKEKRKKIHTVVSEFSTLNKLLVRIAVICIILIE